MSKTAYIYGLTDPRTDAICYVGRTICSLNKRLTDHLASPVNGRMRRWFDELRSLGLRPVICALEEVDPTCIIERELFWVAKLAAAGVPLLNRLGDVGNEPLSDKPEDVRITLRLPKDLHEWLNEVAAGDKRRPPASLNATIIFALRKAQEVMETEPGKWELVDALV